MDDLPYPLHPRGGFSESAHTDLFILDLHRTQRGLPEYTIEQRAAILAGLRLAHPYSDEPSRDFAQLAHEFESQHGSNTLSISATDEWDALMKLSAAEQSWHQKPTSRELRFMTPDELEQRMVHLTMRTGDLETMYDEVFQMNHYSRTALRELREQISLPRESRSRAWIALGLARARLEEIMHSTADVLSVIMNRFDTARPYRIRLRYEYSQRPTLQNLIEGPIETPLSDDDEVEVINLSDSDSVSEDANAVDLEEAYGHSPPSLGSTPPPSYPGSPESDELGTPPDSEGPDESAASLSVNGDSEDQDAPFGPAAFERAPPPGSTDQFQRELDQDVARATERQLALETPFRADTPVLPSVWDRIDQRNRRWTEDWEAVSIDADDASTSDEYLEPSRPWMYTEGDSTPPQFVHPEDRMIGRSEPNTLIPGTSDELPSDSPSPEYDVTLAEPHWDDPCILRSMVFIAGHPPEHYLTFVDHRGVMYIEDDL
ncbi:hypothetical protein B0H15DRAFT_801418 [Mycena belliarum]|uniref:Uncharacterized protein n=1 Tax=Mycena belliarum TaxID=1033014 RepID=A0AAD6XLP7_9AGAR|nr:hypothetical protein B0H15DRAFT_801418 [Mycena belliae]